VLFVVTFSVKNIAGVLYKVKEGKASIVCMALHYELLISEALRYGKC